MQLTASNDELISLKKDLAKQKVQLERHGELEEINSQSQKRIDELVQQLSQLQASNNEKLNQSITRIQTLEAELDQSHSRIGEMTDKLNQSQVEEADNLSTMQQVGLHYHKWLVPVWGHDLHIGNGICPKYMFFMIVNKVSRLSDECIAYSHKTHNNSDHRN